LSAGVYIGDNPPANPVTGQLWWQSSTGNTFISYNDGNSTQWVQFNTGPPLTGDLDMQGYSILNLKGEKFLATQQPSSDPNTLDDYREGTFATAVSAATGSFSNMTATMDYIKIGRVVTIRLWINIVTNGTAAGTVNATLPFVSAAAPPAGGGYVVIAGREATTTGKMLQGTIGPGGTSVSIFNYDNTYPGGNNYQLTVAGSYFAAS
jgi:hypothetical protein